MGIMFVHTLEKVLARAKSQTRRLVKAGETYNPETKQVRSSTGRLLYEVGKTYAVLRGRGFPAVGRLLLTGIRLETVDKITEADAVAEGFVSRADFFRAWRKIHGQNTNMSCQVWVLEFELCQ